MDTSNTLDVAQGISNFGMMAMSCAFFLILSSLLWIACFKWFKSVISKTIDDNANLYNALLEETRKQNDMLNDISEGLRHETQLRIKNTSGIYFDYAIEVVCRLVKKVKDENHISDKEATERKVHTLLHNLHEDRNSRFDYYTYRGRKLSKYTSPEWVEWVKDIVLKEVYAEEPNENRLHTNMTTVYDKIKIDFYHRMNSI